MRALDHVFVFVPPGEARPGGGARRVLDGLGLVPSYERRHGGQGTANVCWCFDDAFLELLFVVDEDELDRPDGGRNGFRTRAASASSGASPFGIAVRGGPPPGPTRPYRFEGLPPHLSIEVTMEADDPRAPFVFSSPGTAPPIEWPDGRAAGRQTAAGFAGLAIETLILPPGAPFGAAEALAAAGVIGDVHQGEKHGLVLRLTRVDGTAVCLSLPEFAVRPLAPTS